jgi:acyl carrier protein
VPIGRPVANTRLYVLEAGLGPAPVGVPGELYIGGVQVGRGYAGRPELTAERFVPDPFGPEPGGRLYRTGDRVRRLASGELEYLGRTDFQVKLRGFRIEPGEVEAALLRHPAVREAVATVREDAPGDPRLVGYVVPEEGAEAPAPEELRAFLGRTLPEHMVPGALVVLDALPLTPNGKTDRGALPAPERADTGAYAAPAGPVEAFLATAWGELLGVERVGTGDDFFALGGHSLLAARLAALVHELLQVEVSMRDVFEAPTVAALARVVVAREAAPGRTGTIVRTLEAVNALAAEEVEQLLMETTTGE